MTWMGGKKRRSTATSTRHLARKDELVTGARARIVVANAAVQGTFKGSSICNAMVQLNLREPDNKATLFSCIPSGKPNGSSVECI